MRKGIAVIVCGALICTAGVAAHARPAKRLDPATKTCRIFTPAMVDEGRQIFRSLCKSCHSRDNKAGAPFIHSESLISRAWNRVFAQRYPRCAKNGAWSSLSDEQLRRVNDYLYMNSADSYDPNNGQDCG